MTALSGLRVVELAHERIAFAGKLLGDMGADVILVEPPGGDPSRHYPPFVDDSPGETQEAPDARGTGRRSAAGRGDTAETVGAPPGHERTANRPGDAVRSLHFLHYNTSKRSLVLDLDRPEGLEAFRELMGTADILLESEPIRRLAMLGADYADLARLRGDLIHAAVTPYGRGEPLSDLPTTDLTLMAAGGPPWSCGYDDHSLPPVRGWGYQGHQTGCHFAVMSILTALLHRNATGKGQFIDISITAALNITTEAASYNWLVAGTTVQRQTGRHAAVSPTGETQLRCADGRYVNTGVPPRFPEEFARLLGWLRELQLDGAFPELLFLEMGAAWEGPFDLSLLGADETITAVFAAGREALALIAGHVSAYEFFIGCQRAGLAVGVIYSPDEAFEDEHFRARGFQVPLFNEELGREIIYPGAPYRLHASPWAISRQAPRLGEHTAEILAELPKRH